MPSKNSNLDFTGQNLYVGIDVHKKSFTVSIRGEELLYKTFSQAPSARVLADHLRTNYPGAEYHAAYEAGFSGFWLQKELEGLGIGCIVVNPCDVPTTDKEKKQKRDAVDSKKLARSLANGELAPVHVPDLQLQQDRSLVRVRQQVVGNLTRCRNRIKALLHFYGTPYPGRFLNRGCHWSKGFMCWLENCNLGHQSGDRALGLLVSEAHFLRELLLGANKDIMELSRTERYRENVELLISIPGIGRLTAMVLMVQIGDIKRFGKLDRLCSYIGFVPNVHASGEREYTGSITKRGNRKLRANLIESSWIAVRNDPALSMKYQQLCQRMSGNKAIVRIARKLTNRIRYVLVNKKEYRIGTTA